MPYQILNSNKLSGSRKCAFASQISHFGLLVFFCAVANPKFNQQMQKMRHFKILILALCVVYSLSLKAQEVPEETTQKEYRTEWGSAYKRTMVVIRYIKKVGFLIPPVLVEVMAVKNLSTSQVFYYIQFTGYELSQKQIIAKTALINSEELDEVIGFFKGLGEYIKEKPTYYTSYEYQDHDKEMSFGAYYRPNQTDWKLYLQIDPVGETPTTVFLKSENISEIYLALLSSKSMITRLEQESK